MNNEPVAWIIDVNMADCDDNFIWNTGGYPDWQVEDWIPLYTHPAKTLKQIKGINYWVDAKPKTLTDEEILQEAENMFGTYFFESIDDPYWIEFARAILRKAQEK